MSHTILVADDEPTVRLIYSRALEAAGYDVVTAEDGTAALGKLLSNDPPMVAILDWHMPGMTGLDVCRELRAAHLNTYVILATMRTGPNAVVDALDAGADDYVAKPCSPQELVARVRVALRTLRTRMSGAHALAGSLWEAMQHPSAEVIVREGETHGRILTLGSRIVWAHVSTEKGALTDLLTGEGVGKTELQEVVGEARRTGRNFIDLVVEWGLVEAEPLRARLRYWVAAKLSVIADMDKPEIVVVPVKAGATTPDIVQFSMEEVCEGNLLDAMIETRRAQSEGRQRRLTTRPIARGDHDLASVDEAAFEALFNSGQADYGMLALRAVDAHVGSAVAHLGIDVDDGLVWRMFHFTGTFETGAAQEAIVTTSDSYHLMLLTEGVPLYLYAQIDLETGNLAFARLAMRRELESWAD